jgi:hypothetical protein
VKKEDYEAEEEVTVQQSAAEPLMNELIQQELSSTSFPIHSSLINLLFGAIESELFKESLNEPRTKKTLSSQLNQPLLEFVLLIYLRLDEFRSIGVRLFSFLVDTALKISDSS